MIPQKIFDQTYKWEKGWDNDPVDLGGLTNDGITYGTYTRLCQIIFKRKPSIKHFSNLTMVEKKQFYNYSWYIVRCDSISHIAAAGLFFDFNFNSDGAEKISQKMLNDVYGYNLDVDGIVGNKTIAAINGASEKNIHAYIDFFQDARTNYVKSLVAKRPSQIKFLQGWLNRINDWHDFAVVLAMSKL